MHHLPNNMTKLTMEVPSTHTWRPGQHYFLRFPSISLLDNHPFTASSIPRNYHAGYSLEEEGSCQAEEPNILTFLILAHSGFTKKLSNYIRSSSNSDPEDLSPAIIKTKAYLDGPYGGLPLNFVNLELHYDTVILVAGGGGISSVLPWLSYLTKRMSRAGHCLTTQVHLLWIVRERSCLEWVEEELRKACGMAPEGTVLYELWVTREKLTTVTKTTAAAVERSQSDVLEQEKQIVPSKSDPAPIPHSQTTPPPLETPAYNIINSGTRPCIPEILPQKVNGARNLVLGTRKKIPCPSSSLTFYTPSRPPPPPLLLCSTSLTPITSPFLACGPESLKTDVANTVAKLQSWVFAGKSGSESGSGSGTREIVLHMETFGW